MGQQMTTYVSILSGLTVLLYLTGLDDGNNVLFNLLSDPSSITTSLLYIVIFSGIASNLGTVVVGFFTKNIELSVMSFIMPTLFGVIFIPPFVGAFKILYTVNPVLSLLLSPVLLLFVLLAVDYYRGRD